MSYPALVYAAHLDDVVPAVIRKGSRSGTFNVWAQNPDHARKVPCGPARIPAAQALLTGVRADEAARLCIHAADAAAILDSPDTTD